MAGQRCASGGESDQAGRAAVPARGDLQSDLTGPASPPGHALRPIRRHPARLLRRPARGSPSEIWWRGPGPKTPEDLTKLAGARPGNVIPPFHSLVAADGSQHVIILPRPKKRSWISSPARNVAGPAGNNGTPRVGRRNWTAAFRVTGSLLCSASGTSVTPNRPEQATPS